MSLLTECKPPTWPIYVRRVHFALSLLAVALLIEAGCTRGPTEEDLRQARIQSGFYNLCAVVVQEKNTHIADFTSFCSAVAEQHPEWSQEVRPEAANPFPGLLPYGEYGRLTEWNAYAEPPVPIFWQMEPGPRGQVYLILSNLEVRRVHGDRFRALQSPALGADD